LTPFRLILNEAIPPLYSRTTICLTRFFLSLPPMRMNRSFFITSFSAGVGVQAPDPLVLPLQSQRLAPLPSKLELRSRSSWDAFRSSIVALSPFYPAPRKFYHFLDAVGPLWLYLETTHSLSSRILLKFLLFLAFSNHSNAIALLSQLQQKFRPANLGRKPPPLDPVRSLPALVRDRPAPHVILLPTPRRWSGCFPDVTRSDLTCILYRSPGGCSLGTRNSLM